MCPPFLFLEVHTMAYDELYHAGIKGMKWGVRNGPPYPLAAKVSARIKKSAAKREERRKKSDAKKREKALKSTDPKYVYKNRKYLTDKELRDKTNRIQTEQQLKDLSKKRSKNLPAKAVSAGGKVAKDALLEAGKDELKNQVVKPVVASAIAAGVAWWAKHK